ncbi:hypothetical protein CJ195_24525 [Bacillus sp. UMB0899]|nr:hypothetical protein CJ195_24525 [Bacillus sp. UMB0899]
MNKFLTFGTGALALSMLSTTTSSVTTYDYPKVERQIIRMNIVENTSSTSKDFTNIKTNLYNWTELSKDIFGDSKDFTKEEAVSHNNALNKESTIRGKRFKI